MFCQMDKKRLVRRITGCLPFDHRVRTSRLHPPAPPQVTKTVHLLLIPPPCVVIGAKLFSRLPSFHDLIFALPPLFFFSLSDWYSNQMDLLKWGWKKRKKKKKRLVNTSMSQRICKLLICDTKIRCHGAQLVKKAISLSLGLFLSHPRWSGRPITASLSVTNSNKKYHTPLVTRLIETRRLCLKLISLWCLFPFLVSVPGL